MILTARMIRDTLAFKGPMTFGEIHSCFQCDSDIVTEALNKGLENGEIKRVKEALEMTGRISVTLYTTDWVDDVPKAAK